MDCHRLKEMIPAYLGELLTADKRAAFEEHLRDCASCRAEVEGLRAAEDAVRAGAPHALADPGDGFNRRLWDRIERRAGSQGEGIPRTTPIVQRRVKVRTASGRHLRRRPRSFALVGSVIGAAAAVVVLTIWLAGGDGHTTRSRRHHVASHPTPHAETPRPEPEPRVTPEPARPEPRVAVTETPEPDLGRLTRVEPGDETTLDPDAIAHVTKTPPRDEPAAPAVAKRRETPATGGMSHIAFAGRVEGVVEYRGPTSDRWNRLSAGFAVEAGARIRTRFSRASVRLNSGSLVLLDRSTSLSLNRSAHTKPPVVDLLVGSIYIEASHGDRGFTVTTPHGKAVDVSTRFGVVVTPVRTTVVVTDGAVSAETDAGAQRVTTNQMSTLAGRHARPGKPRTVANVDRYLGWVGTFLGHDSRRGLVALYDFREGDGDVIRDVSLVGQPLDLRISDAKNVRWLGTPEHPRGIAIGGPVALTSREPATKIVEACRRTNEFTVEAWIKPSAPGHGKGMAGPTRIVSLSKDAFLRNFTLGMNGPDQEHLSYGMRLRTTETTLNGTTKTKSGPPVLATPGKTVTTDLTHVVFTRAADGATAFYVDGIERAEGVEGGTLENWDATFHLVLANEFTAGRPWTGEMYSVAIHAAALTKAEVARDFKTGRDAYRQAP